MGWREDVKFGIARVSRLFLGDANGGLGTEFLGTYGTVEYDDDADIPANIQSVELNNTVGMALTIADAADHQGLFVAKAIVEPAGTPDHTITLTAGTFDGTNNIATFADINDALVVYFDSAGNGTIVENVGTVVLST